MTKKTRRTAPIPKSALTKQKIDIAKYMEEASIAHDERYKKLCADLKINVRPIMHFSRHKNVPLLGRLLLKILSIMGASLKTEISPGPELVQDLVNQEIAQRKLNKEVAEKEITGAK